MQRPKETPFMCFYLSGRMVEGARYLKLWVIGLKLSVFVFVQGGSKTYGVGKRLFFFFFFSLDEQTYINIKAHAYI
jgi:hypothetical protein